MLCCLCGVQHALAILPMKCGVVNVIKWVVCRLRSVNHYTLKHGTYIHELMYHCFVYLSLARSENLEQLVKMVCFEAEEDVPDKVKFK